MKLSSFLHFAGFGIKTVLFRKKSLSWDVIVTDKCNLKCKHCSVNNITAVVHPYEQIRREMQQLYDMGIRILFFCGGETFLWRDGERTLRDLVVEAKEMGFLIVNVVTNGTFPIDLPEADLILLSLDGDRERHNAVRGDTYDTIMENIKHATSDNICFYMAINQDQQGCCGACLPYGQRYQKCPGSILKFPHALSGHQRVGSLQRGKNPLLRCHHKDDEGRCAGVQSAERFPLSDQQQLPDALPPMRGHRKRKSIHLWTLYRCT